jgi:hypothetical protein
MLSLHCHAVRTVQIIEHNNKSSTIFKYGIKKRIDEPNPLFGHALDTPPFN